MIMPFSDDFFEVYEMLKREFDDDFEFSNAGEEGNQQNILKDIIQPIYEADSIIADLTSLNPNVMYELGLAHTFNKKTIVITQDDFNKLPFDLKQYRAHGYSTHFKKFAELLEYLRINLHGAITGDVVYSNPVKDFLTLNKKDASIWLKGDKPYVMIDETDKGFLDFLADIEDDVTEMTSNINDMISDLNEMTEGINHSSSEIDRVNKSKGSGTAAFVRKEAKKVAGFMEIFSKKLKQYNQNISALWDKTEKNTLGLLENDHARLEQNKDSLISYLKSLKTVQDSIASSSESIEGMKSASLKNLGMERSLNQSIRFLDEDLQAYINIMERMTASIDKIIGKSRFVVGEIDFSLTDINENEDSENAE